MICLCLVRHFFSDTMGGVFGASVGRLSACRERPDSFAKTLVLASMRLEFEVAPLRVLHAPRRGDFTRLEGAALTSAFTRLTARRVRPTVLA